jgi:hypothetical protein
VITHIGLDDALGVLALVAASLFFIMLQLTMGIAIV